MGNTTNFDTETLYVLDADTDVLGNWTKGNDAAFLTNAGATTTTFTIETASPLRGTRSYKLSGLTANDWVASQALPIAATYRGKTLGIKIRQNATIVSDTTRVKLYDVTNSAEIDATVLNYVKNGTDSQTLTFIVPPTCASIKLGYHCITTDAGSITFDLISVSANPFVYKNLTESENWMITQANTSMTSRTEDFCFSSAATVRKNNTASSMAALTAGSGILKHTEVSSVSRYYAQKDCRVTVSSSGSCANSGTWLNIKVNGTEAFVGDGVYTNSGQSSICAGITLKAGDYFTLGIRTSFALQPDASVFYASFMAEAESEHVVTPAKSNMSDWIAYSPQTRSAGFGTLSAIETYYRRVGSNLEVRAKFTTGTVTAADARIGLPDGMLTNVPSNVLVGMWFRGATETNHGGAVIAEPNVGYITPCQYSFSGGNSQALTTNTANNLIGNNENMNLVFSVPIVGWASDVTFLAAIPVEQVAVIQYNQAGGRTTLSTSPVLCPLSAVYGDTGIVSILNNKFTLQSGKYDIDWDALTVCGAQIVVYHYLYDETLAAELKRGMPNYVDDQYDHSIGKHTITLTSPKTFGIYFVTTSGTAYIGDQNTSPNDIGAYIKIRKIK